MTDHRDHRSPDHASSAPAPGHDPADHVELFVDGIDFAEGPRWHDGALWYSDFYQHTVYRVSPDGDRDAVVRVEGQPSGLGWLPDGRLLVVSMLDRRVLRLEADGLVEHADLSAIATFHCNDMVVDQRGNAYVGNFGFDLHAGVAGTARGATLALVLPDGTARPVADDLMFPNGSVITPDGTTLIVGESMGARYTAFTIGDDGSLTDRRIWAEIPGTAPDGCALDAAGGIWFADALGSRLLRVVEGGAVTDEIPLDSPVFACTLGGHDGRTLFALTAPGAAPEAVAGRGEGAIVTTRVAHPHAGCP